LGIRLNWHKRYITLGPVRDGSRLAFKLRDPDHLLGTNEDIGITVALVPTNLPAVEIGRRHFPAMNVFQNGPNWGRDVFLPNDPRHRRALSRSAKGWKMLMSALAAGRGISLPSLSRQVRPMPPTPPAPMRGSAKQSHVSIGQIRSHSGAARTTSRPPAYLRRVRRRRMTLARRSTPGHKPAVVTAS